MTAIEAFSTQLDMYQYASSALRDTIEMKRKGKFVPDQIPLVLRLVESTLLDAYPTFVAGWAVDTLEDAVNTFPEEYIVSRSDVPYPTGWVFLEKPLVLATRPDSTHVIIDAISWDAYASTGPLSRWVTLLTFGITDDVRGAKREPKGIYTMNMGEKISGKTVSDGGYIDSTGPTYQIKTGDPEFLQGLWEAEEVFVSRFIVSLWLFMAEKRFVTVDTEKPQRAFRRAWEKTGMVADPIVRTIVLRASQQPLNAHAAPSSREYSSRWVVRGHWHRYWVKDEDDPAKKRLKPRWVSAYVKGPEGAALKTPLRLFTVTK